MEVKDMREMLKAANQTVPRSNEDVVEAFLAAQEVGLFDEQMAEAEQEVVEAEPDSPDETETLRAELNALRAKLAAAGNDLNAPSDESEEVEAELWTYVGAGDTPPHMINFMGMQRFVRGQPVLISDAFVLSKMRGNPCFVEGEVSQGVLFKNDEKAALEVATKRAQDLQIQLAIDRQNSKG